MRGSRFLSAPFLPLKMRLILLFVLIALNLKAQVFSRTDSGFGGAARPAFTWTGQGFIAADEDRDALGTLQLGSFDSLGTSLNQKSYDFWVSDSIYRVSPCYKCLHFDGEHYRYAQTEFVRNDSVYVRFLKFNSNLDTTLTIKHHGFEGAVPVIWDWQFDTDSTFMVTGYVYRLTTRNKYDLWVARFDTAFNPLWQVRIPDSMPNMNGGYYGYDIALDEYGSVLVSGRESYYDLGQRIYIDHSFSARLDRQTGALKWWHAFNQDVGSMNIAATDNGDGSYSFARLEVLAYFQNSSLPNGARLRFGYLDTAGQVIYDTITGPLFSVRFEFTDLVKGTDGNLYLAGEILIPPDKKPIAAYKFSPQGDSLWFRVYAHLGDSTDQHQIWAYQEAPDSGFLHLGVLRDFDNDITPVRQQHFYMLRTNANGCLVPGCESISVSEWNAPKPSFNLYPNPARNRVALQWEALAEALFEEGLKVQIRNSSGQLVLEESISDPALNSHLISIENWKPGLYLVQVLQGEEAVYQEKLIKQP